MNFLIKVIVSALLIALATEISKRSTALGAVIISLPITSIIAMTLLFIETNDTEKVMHFSEMVAWVVLPSIIFFIVMAAFLKAGLHFIPSIAFASIVMLFSYLLYIKALHFFGIKI